MNYDSDWNGYIVIKVLSQKLFGCNEKENTKEHGQISNNSKQVLLQHKSLTGLPLDQLVRYISIKFVAVTRNEPRLDCTVSVYYKQDEAHKTVQIGTEECFSRLSVYDLFTFSNWALPWGRDIQTESDGRLTKPGPVHKEPAFRNSGEKS